MLSFNEQFTVYSKECAKSFLHIKIDEPAQFYLDLIELIFDRDRIIQFAHNKSSIKFEPSLKQLTDLYRQLIVFIDEENVVPYHDAFSLLLNDEFEQFVDENGIQKIRLDKIGKLGEYIMHNILKDHFSFDCIVPKVNLSTSPNMSVYGIDAIFLDVQKKELMFGESKVSNTLDNGMSLIRKSLQDYERQINNEFKYVIDRKNFHLSECFTQLFDDADQICVDFKEFKEVCGLKEIGIPIFIAHGNEIDEEKILNSLLSAIKLTDYFGLKTNYYLISLPIISKCDFTQCVRTHISDELASIEMERDYAKTAKCKR